MCTIQSEWEMNMSDIIYDLTLLCLMFWFTWKALKVVRLWRGLRRDTNDYYRGQELIEMGLPKNKND